MLSTLLGIVTEVKPLQPWKAYSPMLVTLLPIVTEVKPVQPEKALPPMLVTLLGIVTEVKPVHFQKAELPMLSTLLGIIIDVRFEKPEQRFAGIYSTSSPNIKDVIRRMNGDWSVKSEHSFAFHITELKPLQSRKAIFPMLVTLLPIVTEVKPLQPWKA